MTVRKKRAGKPQAGADSANEDGRDIGWGVGADPAADDLFMRKVLFSVLLAVIGCMGAWFTLTTVSGNRSEAQPVLSVTGTSDAEGAQTWFTVKLVEFPPEKRATANQLAAQGAMQQLADGEPFQVLALEDCEALCVGRFADHDAPELQRLLARCRLYSEGGLDFSQANILTYEE
jgi:hypothetical protein